MKIDKEFLAEQKKLLQQRESKVFGELKVGTVKNPNDSDERDAIFPDYGNKEDENAAEVAAFEGNLSMEKNLELSLFNIRKALKKIDDGDYGICEKCSNMIKPERLRAFPSATACMKCKKKFL